jgi:hypothetical protein
MEITPPPPQLAEAVARRAAELQAREDALRRQEEEQKQALQVRCACGAAQRLFAQLTRTEDEMNRNVGGSQSLLLRFVAAEQTAGCG